MSLALCPCSVTELCLTLCDPMDCNLPGSSVYEIFPARIGVVPFPSAGDLPDPGIETTSPALAGGFFTFPDFFWWCLLQSVFENFLSSWQLSCWLSSFCVLLEKKDYSYTEIWRDYFESACSAGDTGDTGSILSLERSPGGGKWQPTPVFLPENSMDRGAWQATVSGVPKSRTQLGNWRMHACTCYLA